MNQLLEIQQRIMNDVQEFKQICKELMSKSEYEQFKYRTLGHLEPAISEDTIWATKYSSIDSLEKVALRFGEEEEEDEQDEDWMEEDGPDQEDTLTISPMRSTDS
jgi:hypothetical protein